MQLMVIGMHRSGTSALARLLNMMGAYFAGEGASLGASQSNPKGFWERRDVMALNDSVLHSVGCAWNRVSEFDPSLVPEPVVARFIQQASTLVLAMDAHRPWFIKDPRLCLLLGLWRQVLELPVCVHIQRNPVEVAASLQRRNGIPVAAGLAMWEAYTLSAQLTSSGLPGVQVSHRQLMQEPMAAVQSLYRQLEVLQVSGLRMPSRREVDAFIDGDLYREQATPSDLMQYRDSAQIRLFEELVAGGDIASLTAGGLSADSVQALVEYESSLPPLSPLPTSAALREKAAKAARDAKDAKLMADVRSIKDALNTRLIEVTRLADTVAERDRDLAKAAADLAGVSNQFAGAQARIVALTSRLESGGKELDRMRARVELQDVELGALKRRLAEIQSSRSWRLVQSLRSLGRAGPSDPALISGSGLFDAAWYLQTYPDVAENGLDPIEHYLQFGAGEGRDPGPTFCTREYLLRHPDVAAAAINPLVHYLRHGRIEGRENGGRLRG